MDLRDAAASVGFRSTQPSSAGTLAASSQSKHRRHGVLKVSLNLSLFLLLCLLDEMAIYIQRRQPGEAEEISKGKAKASSQPSPPTPPPPVTTLDEQPARTPPKVSSNSQRAHQPSSSFFRIPPRISFLSQAARSANLWNPLNSSVRTFSPPRLQNPISEESNPPDILPHPQPVKDSFDLLPPSYSRAGNESPSPSSLRVEQSSFRLSSNRNSRAAIPLRHPRSPKGKEPIRPPQMTTTLSSYPSSFTKPSSPEIKDLESGSTPSHHSPYPLPGELPWGPSHPCFPHQNPHVPLSSPLAASTRIIRIRRDWLVRGDLAPCFSNIYPEILEPWISEQDFRILIRSLNERLIEAFEPGGSRAWTDTLLGLASGWLWEDLGFAGVKGKVKGVENFIEGWNEKRRAEGEVKLIPLRRTGFLSLDIQIPDPHVDLIDPGSERSTGHSEPEVAS